MKGVVTILLIFLGSLSIIPVNAQTKKELVQRIEALEKANFGALTDINTLKGVVINLQSELLKTKNDNESLKQQISNLSKAASSQSFGIMGKSEQNFPTTLPGQCKAITSAGVPCSRKADPGSEYCWQHKKTYEPNSTPNNLGSPSNKSGSSGGSTGSGKTIYTGPRGGKYYINSNGNKTYIKR